MGRAWRRSPPRSALPSERIAPSGATADDLGLCILALRLHQAPTIAPTASTARAPSTAAGTFASPVLGMPSVGVSEGGVFSSGSVNIDRRRPLNERARAHGEAPCPQGGIGHHRALHDAGLPRRGEADGLLHRKRPPGEPLRGGRVLLDARHGCRRLRPPRAAPRRSASSGRRSRGPSPRASPPRVPATPAGRPSA